MTAKERLIDAERSSASEAATVLFKALGWDSGGLGSAAEAAAERIARLDAEVARLRALLREGRGHHGAAGMFCVRGTLEDGTPCPTCAWVRRVDAELAPPDAPT